MNKKIYKLRYCKAKIYKFRKVGIIIGFLECILPILLPQNCGATMPHLYCHAAILREHHTAPVLPCRKTAGAQYRTRIALAQNCGN